jgi:uncharacterized protein (DUF1499 family)
MTNRNLYDEPATSGVSRLAVLVGAVSLLALLLTGPLHHAGLVGLAGAFTLLKWAVYGALATLLLAIVGIIIAASRRARMATPMTALLMALVAIVPVAFLAWRATRVPAIHDITTDTVQPPAFKAIVPLREHAVNPVEYGGAEVAAKQTKAYPDVTPLTLTVGAGPAFDRALAAARAMGWELIASDPATGRIEATDTTFWFGFKDDIVVRVTPQASGSRIDVRSLSRVGVGDIGANAARIRKYLKTVTAA